MGLGSGLGIYSTNGDLEALESFVIDITQQKNSESKLNFYVEELKHSNEDLEDFVYLASHDMQEPLRKIITFSDRLKEKDDSLNEESKDYLSRMQKAALRMLNYIRDLLEYSKVTQQQNNYQRVSFEKSRKWRIEVSGNGIGIKEKYFDRIFKPFERLHGQSEFEETGIGLAIGTME